MKNNNKIEIPLVIIEKLKQFSDNKNLIDAELLSIAKAKYQIRKREKAVQECMDETYFQEELLLKDIDAKFGSDISINIDTGEAFRN